MTTCTYAKRKLKYSRNEHFNLLHYVEWDRFVTLAGSKSELRVTLSYLHVPVTCAKLWLCIHNCIYEQVRSSKLSNLEI